MSEPTLIQQQRDDTAVQRGSRTLISAAHPEGPAHDRLCFVKREPQMHPFRVVLAATETNVPGSLRPLGLSHFPRSLPLEDVILIPSPSVLRSSGPKGVAEGEGSVLPFVTCSRKTRASPVTGPAEMGYAPARVQRW